MLRRSDPADRAAIVEPFIAFSRAAAAHPSREPLTILVRDGSNAVTGGF